MSRPLDACVRQRDPVMRLAVAARRAAALARATSCCCRPLFTGACRFHPSCSTYMADAIRAHGVVRGRLAGSVRLARCHPFGSSGFDPVPPPALTTDPVHGKARSHCRLPVVPRALRVPARSAAPPKRPVAEAAPAATSPTPAASAAAADAPARRRHPASPAPAPPTPAVGGHCRRHRRARHRRRRPTSCARCSATAAACSRAGR